MRTIGYFVTLAARHPVGFEGYYTLENILNGTKVNGKFTVQSDSNGLSYIWMQVEDNESFSGDARILSLYNSPNRQEWNLLWRGTFSDLYKVIGLELDEVQVYNGSKSLMESNC